MSNLYHILYKIPAIESEDMFIEEEQLAQALVKSGLMRVDAEPKSNFTRLAEPDLGINIALSIRQLTDPVLLKETKTRLLNLYQSIALSNKQAELRVEKAIYSLKQRMKLSLPVELNLQLKIARLLVQAAHPIVIRWVLLEKAEIFVSYSGQIGDVMDIATWKYAGQNSGMQSTDGANVAVFVSCGGDPFAETNPESPTYGDGWPAIARIQIIVAQELGHYADIIRDSEGRQLGRHSANFSGTKAKSKVLYGRRNDVIKCKALLQKLATRGLNQLVKYENNISFYKKNKVSGLRLLSAKLMAFFYRKKIIFLSSEQDFLFVKVLRKEQYLGKMIKAMILDMLFNLTPVADVYKREDKEAEEAMACVEALARVPQQVIKWGHITTKIMMSNLYKVYYREVIPSLIFNYQKITKQTYHRNHKKMPVSLRYRFTKLLSLFKKKSYPSREV